MSQSTVFIFFCISVAAVNGLSCSDPSFHCSSCQPQGTCSQCQSGFYSMNYSEPCLNCSGIEGCNMCNDYFGCAQCSDKYLHVQVGNKWTCLRNGTCKELYYHCAVCHTNGCDQCETGFYKMNYIEPCINCSTILGCNGVCNDFFGCAQCRDGYRQVKDTSRNNTYVCELKRQKCSCKTPVANSSCPFSYDSTCEPVSKIPNNAQLLNPMDCALWEWKTTCKMSCDPTTGCADIPKPQFDCNDPLYVCTSYNGTCKWDYSCNTTVIECYGSMCDCGSPNDRSGLICADDVLPDCNCVPAKGKCVSSYVCPATNSSVTCAKDACLNCYDYSKTVPTCDGTPTSSCLAHCMAFTNCTKQANNTCGYSVTSEYIACMAACQSGSAIPKSGTCSSTLTLCTCLSLSDCAYILFQTSFTIGTSLSQVTYSHEKCVNTSSIGIYTNDYSASVITTSTPGVRAQCYNNSVNPIYSADVKTLLDLFSSPDVLSQFEFVISTDQKKVLSGVTLILSVVIPPYVNDSNSDNVVVTMVVDAIAPTSASSPVSSELLSVVIKNSMSAVLSTNKIAITVDVVQIHKSSKRTTSSSGVSSFLATSSVIVVPQTTPSVIITNTPTQQDTPVNAPVDTPVDTPVYSPVDTPVDTPVYVPVDTPIDTPAYDPVDTPVDTPIEDNIRSSDSSDSTRLTIIIAVMVVVCVVLVVTLVVFVVVRYRKMSSEHI